MKKIANSNPALSKRMQTIVDMVDEAKVADVGCDHAFVSIELALRETTETVIAMDVRKGPLAIAEQNIKAHGLSDVIETRLSDGLEKLSVGEVDVAVIAGMGGLLIVRILERAVAHTKQGIHLILQPQSELDSLRAYLQSIGYCIQQEEMLIDEGKYYTVIKAIPTSEQTEAYTEAELLYGPILLEKKHPVLKQYLEEQYDKQQALYEKLAHINTDKATMRVSDLESELARIKECLDKLI